MFNVKKVSIEIGPFGTTISLRNIFGWVKWHKDFAPGEKIDVQELFGQDMCDGGVLARCMNDLSGLEELARTVHKNSIL